MRTNLERRRVLFSQLSERQKPIAESFLLGALAGITESGEWNRCLDVAMEAALRVDRDHKPANHAPEEGEIPRRPREAGIDRKTASTGEHEL